MKAGGLRHKVVIERQKTTRSAAGQRTLEWETVATVLASIEPLQGREFYAAQQVNAEVTTRITIRYVAGITAAMRVVHEGKHYNIISPPIDRRAVHRDLQLMCGEGLNDG